MGAEPSAHGVDVATIARHSQRRTLRRRARARRRPFAPPAPPGAVAQTGRARARAQTGAWFGVSHLPGTNAPPASARSRRHVLWRAADDCLSPDGATRERHPAGPPNQHPSVNGRVQNGKLAALSALGLPHCARSATLRQRSSHLSNGLFSCLTKHCRSPSTIALAS